VDDGKLVSATSVTDIRVPIAQARRDRWQTPLRRGYVSGTELDPITDLPDHYSLDPPFRSERYVDDILGEEQNRVNPSLSQACGVGALIRVYSC
jgi:hypothetical protein